MPNSVANEPPTSGPMTLPQVSPACIIPKLTPSFSIGTRLVAIARHALHNPAAKPCSTRTPNICSGVVTMPPKKYDRARPAPARTAIIFLPRVSAILPQIGAMIPPIRKVMEKIAPFHIFTSSALTPSSFIRYIGKKGISMV